MLFKKEVRVTRNLNECNGIRELLSKNGIRTFVTTNTPTNPGRYHGVPFIDPSAAYQYHIYVGKKDEEEALRILQRLQETVCTGRIITCLYFCSRNCRSFYTSML